MSKDLKEFVLNNKKFLKLSDGESVRAVYRGFRIGPNRFDPDKEVVAYQLSIDGMEAGKVVNWECGRMDVAEVFNAMAPGTEVIISRSGSDTKDTKYDIKKVNETPSVAAGNSANGATALIDKKQQDSIISNCKAKGITGERLLECLKTNYRVNALSKLPAASFDSIIEWILRADYPKKADSKKTRELIDDDDETVPF